MIKNISSTRKILCCICFSTVLALITIICYPFAISSGYGSLGYYAYSQNSLVGLFLFIGCFLGSFILSFFIFSFLDKHETISIVFSGNHCKYINCLYAYPFTTAFITLLVFYIPYIVATYPALVHVDSVWILWRVFGYSEMSTHFPLGYSLLFAYSFKLLSTLFNSSNIAFFIMSFGQMLLIISSMAFSIKMLIKVNKLHWQTIIFLMMFFIICPRINNYMMNLTKDVLYTAALIFYMIALWYIPKTSYPTYLKILLVTSSIVISLTRNEGIIVVITSLALAIIFYKRRNIIIITSVVSLCLFILFSSILPSALNITKGSGREMLSIPLMQTSRYVFSAKDQVTDEEEQAILSAFSFKDLEEMARNYEPCTSDWTKNAFEYDIFSDNAKAYYKVWIDMFKKRPDIYISSIIASNYQYLFPCNTYDVAPYNWTEYVTFVQANDSIGTNFYYPSSTSNYRYNYESVRESVSSHFPIAIINCPGVVTWTIILWFFCIIYKKTWDNFILFFPAFIITVICILSPCDGFYCRYQYPLLVYLPIATLFCFHNV